MSAAVLPALDFELLFAALPAPVAALAPDGTLLALNTALGALLGPAAPAPGQPLAAVRAALEAAGRRVAPAAAWAAGLPAAGAGTVRVLAPDWAAPAPAGGPAPGYWEATLQPVPAPSGEVRYLLLRLLEVSAQAQDRQDASACRAEAEAADQRLRRQTESLPFITFVSDQAGRVLHLSPQWYAYTGTTPADDLDAVWRACLHPDDAAHVRTAYAAALAAGRPWRYELRLRRHDGAYRWFVSQGVPEPEEDARAAGRARQWFGSDLDIHELRETRHRVEQKDQQLSQILSQSPAAIAALDGPEHRFVFINPAFDALLEHRARLGEPVAACVPEVVEQGFIDLLDRVYRTGQTFVGQETPVTFRHPAAGPQQLYFDLTYQALRDGRGHVTGVLAFAVDVTGQVRDRLAANSLQGEVQAADARLRRQAEALPIVTFITDAGGRTTYISPQWYAYTGQQPGGPWADVDAVWQQVLHPDDRAEAARHIQQSIAEAKLGRVEVRLRGTDGRYRWFITEAVPELDANGRLLRRYGYLLDVHDLRERTEELARSREDFAALADNIAQLAWMADATGHIFWYNQQWYDYTGSTLEAMQGWGWMQVHDPALVNSVNQRYLASIAAGEPWEDTFPLRRHDGQYRWFLSRARPIRDPATGAVQRWFGTNTDVTELRELQQRLSESEEELRIQAESIPQQIWTARPDGSVDFYNHRTAAYLGEAMEKPGAADWFAFVHPDDLPGARARWAAAVAGPRYYEAEFRLRRYDGQYRWFLAQAQARRGPGGQVLKWYGTCTDVHAQHQLTEAVARREEQFRFLAESLPQVVWTSTGVGGNDYVNQRWFDYTGLAPAGNGDRANWAAVIHPVDLGPTNERWQHSVETGEFFETEYRFRRHDGVYRWFLGQGRPQRRADGHILKWFGTCTDIDDQKRAQQQLEAQNARLLRSNEDLDNFVYTASHDLKQPINNMAGIFEELTRTAYFRDPDAVKLIAYFERALGQIYSTIDDLSAIVQGQRQQQEMPAEDVPLAPLVADVIASLQDQVTQSEAVFDLDLATCPTVHFVRPNLKSVIFNLFSNSLKYAAPRRPPRIRLSSFPDATTGRPVLTVQDNGLGIDLDRFGLQLFQLFRRFHSHVEGTGMGLYLVNRIVQANGARLEVASTVGEGTTFTIYL